MKHHLHLIPDLAPGGAATQLRLLTAHALREGDRFTIAALRRPGPRAKAFEAAGARVVWLPRRFPGDPAALWGLMRLASEDGPDVVVSWGDEAIPLARRLARWRGIPWVAARRGGEKSLPIGAALVIAADQEAAAAVDPAKVVVVPNAFDPAIQPVSDEARRRARERLRGAGYDVGADASVIVAALRIDDPAPAEELAWAADLLRVVRPGLRLLVVGDGPGRLAAERFADRAAERGTVLWLGEQPDLAALYAAADVVWVGRGFGAAPTPALEAMAARRPIVIAHSPGRERLIPGGSAADASLRRVQWDDRAGWARATRRLFEDPTRATQLAEEDAAAAGDRHRIDRVAELYSAAIRRVER